MNFLMAIIDAAVDFVRRNPLTTILIVFLALVAPAVLKGIALFILYFLLGAILLGVVLTLAFRWRIYRVRKQMEEQFGQEFDPRQGGFGNPFPHDEPRRNGREGEVRVHKTPGAPEKRVSKDVGDYIDFEEEKN